MHGAGARRWKAAEIGLFRALGPTALALAILFGLLDFPRAADAQVTCSGQVRSDGQFSFSCNRPIGGNLDGLLFGVSSGDVVSSADIDSVSVQVPSGIDCHLRWPIQVCKGSPLPAETVMSGTIVRSASAPGSFCGTKKSNPPAVAVYGEEDLGTMEPLVISVFWLSCGSQSQSTFSVGRTQLLKSTGAALLYVTVPGPGALSLSGAGVVSRRSTTNHGGTVKLRVNAKGAAKRQLQRSGKARVRVEIAYTPTGGTPASQRRNLILRRTA